MTNEIVKYNNEMNEVAFKGFNKNELDFFMAICSKIKNKKTDEIVLSFKEMEELANYKMQSLERFYSDLINTNRKLLSLNFVRENEKKITIFALFKTFEIDKEKNTITVSVNEKFAYLLNEFSNQWTRFELEEFTNISGTYPKHLYKLLKQWKTTGEYTININEFRRLMDIPDWYQMTHIDSRVLKPSIKELRNIKDFENLKVNKIKKGRAVDKLLFEFNEWVKPKPTRKNNRTIEKVQYTLDTEEKADPKAIEEVLAKLKN